MPRKPRLDTPGALHHVMARGIEGTKIFRNKGDFEDFLKRLGDIASDNRISVIAWSLMPNHLHLLIRTGKLSLSDAMRKLLTGYVVNFNKRYKRQGHLFQNRYKSILCEEEPYLLELVRYIHLNPLRAGVVKDIEELNKYPYSGHSIIVGKEKRPWQIKNEILERFDNDVRKAKVKYINYVTDGISVGRRPDLTGGGLIKSMGGWAEVISLRKRKERTPSDSRILGSGEYVQTILEEAEEKEAQSLRLRRRKVTLDKPSKKVAEYFRIYVEELQSGSRKREVQEARVWIAILGVKKLGFSGAEVARYLGVTTSCINRIAASGVMDKSCDEILQELLK